MKIKFNWGTGIVIAFVIMVSAMLYLVSIALRQDNDLVESDYYQKSINYQQHIDKAKNTELLAEKIMIDYSSGSLKLNYPKLADFKEYSGKILFYSPVEAKRDLSINIEADSSYAQIVDLSKIQAGRYMIKIDWQISAKAFYKEEELIIE